MKTQVLNSEFGEQRLSEDQTPGYASLENLSSRLSMLELRSRVESRPGTRRNQFLMYFLILINMGMISYFFFIIGPSVNGRLNFVVTSVLENDVELPTSYDLEFEKINSILRFLIEGTSREPKDYVLRNKKDFHIVKVSVDKANLRSGPDINSEILMNLPKGTELSAQDIQGSWVKVFAPTGEVSWVSKSVIKIED